MAYHRLKKKESQAERVNTIFQGIEKWLEAKRWIHLGGIDFDS